MNNIKKKGVSDVVSTILIVLLAVAAVAIIGAVVLRNVGDSGSKIEGQTSCTNLEVSAIKCVYDDADSKGINLTYSRGARGSELTLSKMILVVENTAGTSLLNDTAVLNPLQSVTGNFTRVSGIPSKFSVAGVIRTNDGRDVTCPASVKVDCISA